MWPTCVHNKPDSQSNDLSTHLHLHITNFAPNFTLILISQTVVNNTAINLSVTWKFQEKKKKERKFISFPHVMQVLSVHVDGNSQHDKSLDSSLINTHLVETKLQYLINTKYILHNMNSAKAVGCFGVGFFFLLFFFLSLSLSLCSYDFCLQWDSQRLDYIMYSELLKKAHRPGISLTKNLLQQQNTKTTSIIYDNNHVQFRFRQQINTRFTGHLETQLPRNIMCSQLCQAAFHYIIPTLFIMFFPMEILKVNKIILRQLMWNN